MQELTPEERIFNAKSKIGEINKGHDGLLGMGYLAALEREVKIIVAAEKEIKQRSFVDTPECSNKSKKTDREVLDYVAELTEANVAELAGLSTQLEHNTRLMLNEIALIKNQIYANKLNENKKSEIVWSNWLITMAVAGWFFLTLGNLIDTWVKLHG